MSMHNAATTPVMLADAHRDVAPHCYVVWHKPQICQNCGTFHSYSELYAKTHLRSQLGIGKYVTNLRPLDRPLYNLPIEILQNPPRPIPFCAECYSTCDLGQLPPPPKPEPKDVARQLAATQLIQNSPLHPDIGVKKPLKGARKTNAPAPTLDDLIALTPTAPQKDPES